MDERFSSWKQRSETQIASKFQPRRTKHESDTILRHGRRPQTGARDHGGDPDELHMERADDLFGGPQGSPRTDKLIAASIQWAEKIMEKIDGIPGCSLK